MREGGRPAGFKGGGTKRCVNEWKGVFLNPEIKITTYTESGFGSRPGISHNIPQCVGKIRISPCRQSSAPAHCGNRGIGLMDVSRPRITFPGPQVAPSGEMKGKRVTNCESRPFFRNTAFSPITPCDALFTIVHDCSPLFAIVQQKNIVPEGVRAPSGVLVGPHDWPACLITRRGEMRERAVRHFFWSKPVLRPCFSTNHESRVTNHGLYVLHESGDAPPGPRPVTACLPPGHRLPARCGAGCCAAMARHGRLSRGMGGIFAWHGRHIAPAQVSALRPAFTTGLEANEK